MSERVLKNATCTLCGCVCDDVQLELDGCRIVETRRACPHARRWYLRRSRELAEGSADAFLGDRPAAVGEAIDEAAEILRAAAYPLVYGMGETTTEAQRLALQVAETIGAALDSHTSLAHGSTKLASQMVGKVTCTLGEIKNHSDLVVYWGSNPLVTHPRHVTRYSLFRPGRFVPRGRRDRTLIVVDVKRTKTAAIADQFVQVRPGSDFELLVALQTLVRGGRVTEESLAPTGVSLATATELAERFRKARFGVIFFGDGLTKSRGMHLNVAAALSLTRDLNVPGRFTAIPMRNHGNEAGADNVFSWLAGYPFAIDYSRGYPRYNPGEFSVIDLLERGDPDAVLVVGGDPLASLPERAAAHLRSVPLVVLDPRRTATARAARVHIVTASAGLTASGTAYRMDKVPLSVPAPLPAAHASDEQVLERLLERLAASAGEPDEGQATTDVAW